MNVGVVGAGVMGAGIAQVLAVGGHDVVCVDRDAGVLTRAAEQLVEGRFGLRSAAARGKVDLAELEPIAARVTWSADIEALRTAALIIEAVPEDLALKISVFRSLDRIVDPVGILATNSSGLPVAALAAATDRAPLVLGWHWASPAQVMRFAEIVVTPVTDEATTTTVVELARSLGKHPVVVKDHPLAWGYVANRVYFAAAAEARKVVNEGICTPSEVDQLMTDCFRWPVGPFGMAAGATEGWTS